MDGRTDKQKMKRQAFLLLSSLLFITGYFSDVKGQTQTPYHILEQSPDTIFLWEHTTYYQEESNQALSIEQASHQSFRPLTKEMNIMADDRPVWLTFRLQNKRTDSVHVNLYLGRHKRVSCWKGDQKIENGFYVPFARWASKFRPTYLPISLAAGEEQTYLARIEDFMETGRRIRLELTDRDLVFDLIGRKFLQLRVELFSSIFVVGVTIFLFCFTLIQFISFRDKVYLYYSIYLFMMSLQFVKALDYSAMFRILFVHFGMVNLYMDVLIDVVPLFFYAGFVLQILNLKEEAPHTYRQILRFLWVIAAMLTANLLFLACGQYALANRSFLLIWAIQVGGSIWFLQIIYSRLSYPFAKYILFGSLCLLLGAASSFGISYIKRLFDLGLQYPFLSILPLLPLRIGFLMEILCFSFTLGLRMKENERQKEKVRSDLEVNKMALLQTELMALKAQMNPHFVANCLNSIKALIQEQRQEEAIAYLVRFSKLIRSIVDYSLLPEIPLSKELELGKLYLDLESLRLGHSFTYEMSWEESPADLDFFKVPPFLLQPFLENAVWHGFSRETGAAYKLRISVEEGEEGLCCIIEDNGIGREKAAANTHTSKPNSIGIRNVQERLTLLKTLQETDMQLKIIDKYQNDGQATGTRVEILLMY
ncbi:MAG: histidine kinase [Bacteroidota bacterium]